MFTVVVSRPGDSTVELTPLQDSLRFSTVAVGGFGDCSFRLLGDRRRLLPYMATVRVMLGSSIVWEGRVEDRRFTPADDPATTNITCYGPQRILTDVSVRRIWSKRDIQWAESPGGYGTDLGGGFTKNTNLLITTGQYDPTDLSKSGVQVNGNNAASVANYGNVADYRLPAGLTAQRIMCDYAVTGTNTGALQLSGLLMWSTDGSTWSAAGQNGSGSINQSITGSTNVRLGMYDNGFGGTATATDLARFYNIRILGTTITEDASGGFYGDTILRDLIALCPGLTAGLIESGSDFTIPSLERAARDTAIAIVKEIAGYYTREWAVWEAGRVDWRTPNLDEPQWIIRLEDMLPGTSVQESVDELNRTVYVLYSSALDANDAEATASSTDPRNPLVRLSQTKDLIVQAPAVMTANTAAQLATLEAAAQLYPPASGTVVLSATALVRNAVGSPQPAALIRAGTNVYLPDMPKTDSVLAPTRRDGETLFHIASTELDMEAGTIRLQLEGQTRAIDIVTARLAAATRVLTG